MLIYLRKITNNDTKKQIETTAEAYELFFGGESNNSDGVIVTIENSNGTAKGDFKISKAAGNANSYRFSSAKGDPTIANFISDNTEHGFKANDILKIEKKGQAFKLFLIETSDPDYSVWESMLVNKQNTVVVAEEDTEDIMVGDELTPKWFHAKGEEFDYLNITVVPLYEEFRRKFSPDKLSMLNGKDILTTIFLNKENKTNLCYEMEFNNEIREYFGSIKSGTAYKYGLHYSQKNKSWATGTAQRPQFLDEEEAIELGTQIRDGLVEGAKIIFNYGALDTVDDYLALYEQLNNVTDGYVGKVWFMKYYHMIFPEIFPPIYSYNAQNIVITAIGQIPHDNALGRMAQMQNYIKECDITNVVFNKVFWTYCNNDIVENKEEEITKLKNCLDIQREPRQKKIHPINFIIYGAPGTGKTYSTVEYALAIIENRPVDLSPKTDEQRKAVVAEYKKYVKEKQIVFTTFHQNYGYEEFIQGLRPDKESEKMAFKTVDGVFKTIADTALNNTEGKNYVIIIDEINRANISKVFGELITLIEEDKRWGEINEASATLQSGDVFAVPNNLYIVGTMNSADKSISLIDAALRRRFCFIEQKPDANLVQNENLKKVFENFNLNLVKELESTDLLVGHSYFMNKNDSDLCDILNKNIIPLLYEYFYDNRKKVESILSNVIDKAGANIEIIDEKVGRLSVKVKGEANGTE